MGKRRGLSDFHSPFNGVGAGLKSLRLSSSYPTLKRDRVEARVPQCTTSLMLPSQWGEAAGKTQVQATPSLRLLPSLATRVGLLPLRSTSHAWKLSPCAASNWMVRRRSSPSPIACRCCHKREQLWRTGWTVSSAFYAVAECRVHDASSLQMRSQAIVARLQP